MVTAAHCIQDKGSEKPLNPKNTYFVIGKHNLDSTYEEDYETCAIEKFILHPHWINNLNLNAYDGDIAIAYLRFPVQFSKNIQPICLFPDQKNFNDVLSKEGRLAGWGGTEKSELSTSNPTTTKMKITTNSECIKSDPAFAFILGHGSFCAIGKASGVCKGDSGTGLMLKEAGKWKLRGILSATTQTQCATGNFVSFTDAAQYSQWLKTKM